MASNRVIQVLFYSTLILAVYGRPQDPARKIRSLEPGARTLYSTNRMNNVGFMLVPYDLQTNYVYYPADGVARPALPALPGMQGIAVIGQNIANVMLNILNAVGITVRDENNQDAPAEAVEE
ncbi:uncharacterized protein [Epargyreus clarus]|uniref:uncharacterized protein n=1 Tax=Epargyreus clarus TaxID=520877 RepID=UPI003C2E880B